MSDLSRIEMFVEVAKHGSFVGAARDLGLSGPAISKQIKMLEQSLGVKLFYRTTRSVSLTEEGSVYFSRARKAIEDLSEAKQQIQELKECPTGTLKINAPMSFGSQYLTQAIAEFAVMYPHVELDVSFDDRWVDVIAEGFDVVIRIGALTDSTLVARTLAPCPVILCASKEYIEKHGEPNNPEQLSEFPAIIYSRHGQTEDWRYSNNSGDTGVIKLKRAFSGDSAEMQLVACQAGLGIALLPIFAVWSQLRTGQLVHILPNYRTQPERHIYALFPQNRFLSTRVRLFIDYLLAVAQSYPWRDEALLASSNRKGERLA